MKELDEHLAWLLAAEEHPHLKQEKGVLRAEEALQTSPDLQKAFEEARAFQQRHPRLIGFDRMPEDVRERIANRLQTIRPSTPPPMQLHPWSVRKHFAWAAALVLFLAGLSFLTSRVLTEQSPHVLASAQNSRLPEFHRYVDTLASNPPALEHHAENPMELVHWLEQRNAQSPQLPASLQQGKGHGCSVMKSELGEVSLVCVQVQGERMRLFVACAKALQCEPSAPKRVQLQDRPAIEWADESNVYLLINEEAHRNLPSPETLL